MKHATLAFLVLVGLVAPLAAQIRARVQPWVYEPYVRQLGSVHFPAGQAALGDGITAVRALRSGAVVVAGYTYGSLGEAHAGTGATDVFVARFDPSGNLQWISQLGAVTAPSIPTRNGNPGGPGGDASQWEGASGLAVAEDGSIYLAGATTGSLGETNGGLWDLFLARFDAAGSLLWLHQLGAQTAPTIVPEPGATQWGNPADSDAGGSILLRPNGDVYVAGYTRSHLSEDNTSGDADILLVRFDGSGNALAVRQMSGISSPAIGYNPASDEFSSEIAWHPSGGLVLATTGVQISGTLAIERPVLMTFDAALVPLQWTSPGSGGISFSDLDVDPATGRIVVAGGLRDLITNVSDVLAASYDANLNLRWLRVLDNASTTHLGLLDLSSSEAAASVRLDPAGNLVLAGSTGGSLNEPNAGSSDIFTARIRGDDGHVLRVSQLGQTTASARGLDATGGESVNQSCLALGPGGSILLGGSTSGSLAEPSGGSSDVILLRLNSSGGLR
jgi:hypothetical protein